MQCFPNFSKFFLQRSFSTEQCLVDTILRTYCNIYFTSAMRVLHSQVQPQLRIWNDGESVTSPLPQGAMEH